MDKKMIARINELAKKSKIEGLTTEEKAEQAKLRRLYINAFKQGVENTMNNVYIVDENGNEIKLRKRENLDSKI